MIAYEDLVVALTNWRTTQGLPTTAGSFLSDVDASVNLALPINTEDSAETEEILDVDGLEAVDGDVDVEEYSDVEEVSYEEAVEDVTATGYDDESEATPLSGVEQELDSMEAIEVGAGDVTGETTATGVGMNDDYGEEVTTAGFGEAAPHPGEQEQAGELDYDDDATQFGAAPAPEGAPEEPEGVDLNAKILDGFADIEEDLPALDEVVVPKDA